MTKLFWSAVTVLTSVSAMALGPAFISSGDQSCSVVDRFDSIAKQAGCAIAKSNAPALIKPSAKKAAELEKLFTVLEIDKSIDGSWQRLMKRLNFVVFRSIFSQNRKNDKIPKTDCLEKSKEQTQKVLAALSTKLKAKYKVDMRRIYTHVYSKYYTTKDMKKLNEFYTSKAGQKATSKNAKIIKRSMIKLTRKIRPRVEELVEKRLSEVFDLGDDTTSGDEQIINDIME